jgi:lysophospholipase L1-like esterase
MSSATGSKTFNTSSKWLVCIGDSITNSDWANGYIPKSGQYPRLLQQMIGGNCRERNCGVAGDKTSDTLARMFDVLLYPIDVCVIYLGINDNFQAVPTGTTQTNYQSIIDKVKATGCTRIALCNIHNIPGTSGTADAPLNTQRTIIQNLATTNNLPLIDLHSINLVNPTDYFSDIIHPAPSGITKITNAVKTVLDAQGWTSFLQN